MTEQTWSQPITKIEPNKVAVRGYHIHRREGTIPAGNRARIYPRSAMKPRKLGATGKRVPGT